MTQQFPLLFAPFRLGKYDLQSRIVVTGHAANFYDQDKLPTEDYGYYLRERAKGGAGIVTMGNCSVHPTSTSYFLNWDDRIIPKYQRIAELVHEFPVPVLAQLGHGGRIAGVRQREILDGDWLSVAPSAIPTPAFSFVQAMPHEMSTDEVEEMVAAYGRAAGRVREGRLDGAEVQVGSGGLISQFLHSQSNQRTDKYGGATAQDRMTFLYEVLDAVRAALGPDLLLARIHRRTSLGTALEEASGCSSESGIMVLEQKPARKQGAPNRCCHRTNPTVSASSLTTIAWWPMPACSCRPP